MSNNGLMVMDQPVAIMPVMSIQEAIERRQMMVDFVRAVMVEGVDYGTIPGTSKPTLYKPGAEKLNTIFGLSPQFELTDSAQDWLGEDHNGEPFFYFSYRCTLTRGSYVVGQGEGSCNSWEKKHRYRKQMLVCPQCGEETIIKGKEKYGGGWVCWKKQGGCGQKFTDYDPVIIDQPQGDILNENPADLVNTLQKMAQKRALVAATLLAVNASELFTQDVEDMAGFGGDVIDGQWMPADTLKDESRNGPPPSRKPQQRRRQPAQSNTLSLEQWRERLAKNPRPTVTTVASMMAASSVDRWASPTEAVAEILLHFADLDGAGHQLTTEDALGIWDFMNTSGEEE